MATTQTQLLTADDLLRLYSKGVRGELIRGELCETMPSGGKHGEVVLKTGFFLGGFIIPRRLGRLAGSDSGVLLERDPDTVREPDIAYISAERLPLDVEVTGYYEVVPDLVVEVVSPGDSAREVMDKALMWLSYGTRLVWAVNPGSRTVDVYRPGERTVTLGSGRRVGRPRRSARIHLPCERYLRLLESASHTPREELRSYFVLHLGNLAISRVHVDPIAPWRPLPRWRRAHRESRRPADVPSLRSQLTSPAPEFEPVLVVLHNLQVHFTGISRHVV